MTKDEVIKGMTGLSLDSPDLTPMDKGECKKCMEVFARDQQVVAVKALIRIINAEIRPDKKGKVDLSDINELKRIARVALLKIEE